MSIVERKNVIIYFNINYICDNRCKFCFSYHIDNSKNTNVTLQEVKDILSAHMNDDVERVVINGGEPFLNPEIFDIVSEIKKTGYECVVYSNGNALNDIEKVKKLNQTGVDRITVPVHGDEILHNNITGNSTSFFKVTNGLSNIGKVSDVSFKTELKFIITSEMVSSDFDIKGFLSNYSFIEDVVICGQVNTKTAKNNSFINHHGDEMYSYVNKQLNNLKGMYNLKCYDLMFCKLNLDISNICDQTEREYDKFLFFDNEHLGDSELIFNKHGMEMEKCADCDIALYCHSITNNYNVLMMDKAGNCSMVYE